MRILDIAVAAAYGILCLSLISLMSPYGFEQGGAQAAQNIYASSALFSYVSSVGLPFLATATPSQICASVEGWGNSTLVMGGNVGGYACSEVPVQFLGSSSLDIVLSGREVELEAWVEGQ